MLCLKRSQSANKQINKMQTVFFCLNFDYIDVEMFGRTAI